MENVVFFDLETTGKDPAIDRIVEFAFVVNGAPWVERINPGVPIPAEATAVHGISDEDVVGKPEFEFFAQDVQDLVGDSIICGYNIRRFDTLFLHYELRRADMPGLTRRDNGKIVHREIDLYQIWMRHEKRSLQAASKRFAGVDLENAHSADVDALVLPKVLEGMSRLLNFDASDLNALVKLSRPEGSIDRAGKFIMRDDGEVIFNFGPAKDKPVRAEMGLLHWILSKDFPEETKDITRALIDHYSTQVMI